MSDDLHVDDMKATAPGSSSAVHTSLCINHCCSIAYTADLSRSCDGESSQSAPLQMLELSAGQANALAELKSTDMEMVLGLDTSKSGAHSSLAQQSAPTAETPDSARALPLLPTPRMSTVTATSRANMQDLSGLAAAAAAGCESTAVAIIQLAASQQTAAVEHLPAPAANITHQLSRFGSTPTPPPEQPAPIIIGMQAQAPAAGAVASRQPQAAPAHPAGWRRLFSCMLPSAADGVAQGSSASAGVVTSSSIAPVAATTAAAGQASPASTAFTPGPSQWGAMIAPHDDPMPVSPFKAATFTSPSPLPTAPAPSSYPQRSTAPGAATRAMRALGPLSSGPQPSTLGALQYASLDPAPAPPSEDRERSSANVIRTLDSNNSSHRHHLVGAGGMMLSGSQPTLGAGDRPSPHGCASLGLLGDSIAMTDPASANTMLAVCLPVLGSGGGAGAVGTIGSIGTMGSSAAVVLDAPRRSSTWCTTSLSCNSLSDIMEPATGKLPVETIEELTSNTALHSPMTVTWASPNRPLDVTLETCLGRGATGMVYKGLWLESPVAVKFMIAKPGSETLASITTEAVLCKALAHPNLVQTFKWGLCKVSAEMLRPQRCSSMDSRRCYGSATGFSMPRMPGSATASGPVPYAYTGNGMGSAVMVNSMGSIVMANNNGAATASMTVTDGNGNQIMESSSSLIRLQARPGEASEYIATGPGYATLSMADPNMLLCARPFSTTTATGCAPPAGSMAAGSPALAQQQQLASDRLLTTPGPVGAGAGAASAQNPVGGVSLFSMNNSALMFGTTSSVLPASADQQGARVLQFWGAAQPHAHLPVGMSAGIGAPRRSSLLPAVTSSSCLPTLDAAVAESAEGPVSDDHQGLSAQTRARVLMGVQLQAHAHHDVGASYGHASVSSVGGHFIGGDADSIAGFSSGANVVAAPSTLRPLHNFKMLDDLLDYACSTDDVCLDAPSSPPPNGSATRSVLHSPCSSHHASQSQYPTGTPLSDILFRLGAVEGDVLITITSELCDRGCLDAAIKRGVFKPNAPKWDTPAALLAVLQTAREVTQGMTYLHAHGVIHGDLKPSNVLLRSSRADRRGFVAKVGDLGLSRVLAPNCSALRADDCAGTITHMAPEVLDGSVTKAADVYSFGVLLWQLCTGQRPHSEQLPVQIAVGVQCGELQLKFPPTTPRALAALGDLCMRYESDQRPTFEQVLQVLVGLESRLSRRAAVAAAQQQQQAASAAAAAFAASRVSTASGMGAATTSAAAFMPPLNSCT